MVWLIDRFRNEKGQGLVEYGLILALVSVVAVGSLGGVGEKVSDTFSTVVFGPREKMVDGLVEEGYIPLSSAEDLDNIRYNESRKFGEGTVWEGEYQAGLDKKYVQTADIDLLDYPSEAGWEPIGNVSSRSFSGSYNGAGYNINNLYVSKKSGKYHGLFGFVDGASISNMNINDADVNGHTNVGILAGFARSSTVDNVYTSGRVIAEDKYIGGVLGYAAYSQINNVHTIASAEGLSSVGGLLGWNSAGVKISNTSTTGSVFGNERIGGLVGWFEYDSSVLSDSFATGDVVGEKYVGGLVGLANVNPKIINSYARGSVSGLESVGGLVGKSINGVRITHSYSSGLVSGDSDVGGLVGEVIDNSTIINSYWDTTSSKQNSSMGGKGYATDEMIQESSYKVWDFENVWQIESGKYPTLQWER